MIVQNMPYPAAVGGGIPQTGALVAQYDAFDTNSLTLSGSSVAAWNDISGNGKHLSQSTTASRPTRQANGWVRFDGSNDFFQLDFGAAIPRPFSVALVAREITSSTGDMIFDGFGSTDRAAIGCLFSTSDDLAFFSGTSTAPIFTTATPFPTAHYTAVAADVQVNHVYINGAFIETGTGRDSFRPLTMGTRYAREAARSANVEIAFLAIWSTALTEAEITQLDAYLKARFNL